MGALSVFVVAAQPVAHTSDFNCQTSSLWLRPVICQIQLRDQFDNPSLNSSTLAVEVGGVASGLPTSTYKKGPDTIVAMFIAPSDLGLATVSAYLWSSSITKTNNVPIGTIQNITIRPAPVYPP